MCLFSNLIDFSKRSIIFAKYLLVLGNTTSVGWRGEGRNVPPPPEIGKIVVEILCYPPEVCTFWTESEIQEIFSKKLWKKSIFLRDFDEKISKFSWNFSKFSSFLVQTRRVLKVLLSFTCPIQIIHQILMILLFSINSSRFSQKMSSIFMPFSIVLLYLS